MASHHTEKSSDETKQDYRVRVCSRRTVSEQIEKYKLVLSKTLDEQEQLEEETRRVLLQELLANFEAAVLENVLVNGLKWDEAPDEEEDLDLEDQLNEAALESTRRRRTFPRHILPHVVHALRAERLLLNSTGPTDTHTLVLDPNQEKYMKNLSAAAPELVKHTAQVVKSISALQHQMSGLHDIINMSQSCESLQIHQEVLDRTDPPPPHRCLRQPITRAVEEAAVTRCYAASDPGQ